MKLVHTEREHIRKLVLKEHHLDMLGLKSGAHSTGQLAGPWGPRRAGSEIQQGWAGQPVGVGAGVVTAAKPRASFQPENPKSPSAGRPAAGEGGEEAG